MPPEPSPPLVLMVAPNGARRTKVDHPALPITPDEIAREAAVCLEAGATLLHLHVRDADGRHSLDPARYREAIAAVRAEVGLAMAIQVTTEAVGRYGPEEQMACVRALRPEAVSLALREIIPDPDRPEAGSAFLAWLRDEGIAPHYILYTPDEVRQFHTMRARGVVPQVEPFAMFVLGRYAGPGEPVPPSDLLPFLAAHQNACPWALCAFGVEETASLMAAIALGGHARVGFENSLRHGDGRIAVSNAERVAAIAQAARLAGRPLADIGTTRALLAQTAA
jgi:3-keto-5-aminohexanoate cleavage enzyme